MSDRPKTRGAQTLIRALIGICVIVALGSIADALVLYWWKASP